LSFITGYLFSTGGRHCDWHTCRDFTRATNNSHQALLCNLNRLGDKFGYCVGFKTGIIKWGIFLRQQQRFVHFASFINVANVRPGKYATLPFAAENYPSAVAGPTMPGFALIAIYIQPSIFIFARFVCGFEVCYVQVAAGIMNSPGAIIAHARQQPAAVGTNSRLGYTQACMLRWKYGFRQRYRKNIIKKTKPRIDPPKSPLDNLRKKSSINFLSHKIFSRNNWTIADFSCLCRSLVYQTLAICVKKRCSEWFSLMFYICSYGNNQGLFGYLPPIHPLQQCNRIRTL